MGMSPAGQDIRLHAQCSPSSTSCGWYSSTVSGPSWRTRLRILGTADSATLCATGSELLPWCELMDSAGHAHKIILLLQVLDGSARAKLPHTLRWYQTRMLQLDQDVAAGDVRGGRPHQTDRQGGTHACLETTFCPEMEVVAAGRVLRRS